MQFLIDLWLPILASAIAVFFCSFIAWAISPHHKGDFKVPPNEDAMLGAVRSLGLAPGRYMFPFCKNHKDPEFVKKMEAGPMGMLNVWPKCNMGKNMVFTFLTFLATSVVIAYLAHTTLQPGTEFVRVFRVVGAMGVLAYCFSFIPNMIWFNGGCRAILMCFIDGLVFGLVTGAVFGFLWPAASALVPALPSLR